jgi:ferritin
MLKKSVQDALNRHLAAELYSAHLYLAMAGYFEAIALPGFAHWMQVHAEEEDGHARKVFKIIADRNGRVLVDGVQKPPHEFKSPLEVFQQALAHEQEVTAMYHQLWELAQSEKDYATIAQTQWFLEEQVEEERLFTQIVDFLKKVGESQSSLLMLDRHMAKREAGKDYDYPIP